MKMAEVQKIVDEVLDGNSKTLAQLPQLLEDMDFREKYLSLMVDESLLSAAVELEVKNRKLKKTKKKKKKPIPFVLLSTIAAILAFAVILFQKDYKSAYIVEGNKSYPQGHFLEVGTLVKIPPKEQLVLKLHDESLLYLNGPFQGQLTKAGIKLNLGQLEAEINKREVNKFTVKTKHCDIQVVGTKFEVSATAQSTQLKVSEGRVKINDDRNSLEVNPGEYSIASSSIPLKVYTKSESLSDELWRERYSHSINEDLTSEHIFGLFTFASNSAENLVGNFLKGSFPSELKFDKGRNGKPGVSFKESIGNVIACQDYKSEQFKNFTASVWCKSSTTKGNNVILSQRDFEGPEYGGWSLHVIDGFLYVWLVTGIKPDGEIIWIKEPIAPFNNHTWQNIVLTVDNELISVFKNGRKVKSLRAEWRPAKYVRNLTIGGIDELSRNYQGRKRTSNNFNGIIDEVRFYTKPLQQLTIIDLYEKGQP